MSLCACARPASPRSCQRLPPRQPHYSTRSELAARHEKAPALPGAGIPICVAPVVGRALPLLPELLRVRERSDRALRRAQGSLVGRTPHRALPPLSPGRVRPGSLTHRRLVIGPPWGGRSFMDTQRFILLGIFFLSALFLWERWQAEQHPPTPAQVATKSSKEAAVPVPSQPAAGPAAPSTAVPGGTSAPAAVGERIDIKTDRFVAAVDTL